jgi:hypothetical protein
MTVPAPAARRPGPFRSGSRLLFQSALLIFIITVVIGILNGIDLLDPGHDTLITHVHAGTLGWITLSVAGAVLWMFTEGMQPSKRELRSACWIARALVASVGLYVAAFWVGMKVAGGVLRPIAGTLLFLVVAWTLAWLIGRARRDRMTVPRLALVLAWISLLIGAVFGIILGIFTARGKVPGLSTDLAASLAESHPPTMVIGYLMLAGIGIAEWLLRSEHRPLSRSPGGIVQVLLVFLAGVSLLVGLTAEIEPLILVNAPLEVVGLGIFLVRLWPQLRPAAWSLDAGLLPRFGVLGLIAGLGFLVYLVQGIGSGRYETPDDVPFQLIVALDHVNFIGVMANLTFGVIAAAVVGANRRAVQLLVWAMNVGLAGFVIGLAEDSAVWKRISTPVMGTAILIGIGFFFAALARERERELIGPGEPAPAGTG